MIKVATDKKSSSIVVLFILCLLFFLVFFPRTSPVNLENGNHLTKVLKPNETVSATFLNSHVLPKLLLKITLKGFVGVSVGKDKFKLGKRSGFCKEEGENLQCKIIVKLYEYKTPILITSGSSGSKVSEFDWSVVKYKHKTTLSKALSSSFTPYVLAFGLILLLVFSFLSHKRTPLSQWGVICSAILFLLYNDLIFTLTLLFFLYGMYSFRSKVNNGKHTLWKLLSFLFFSVGFILLFKYGKEAVYSIFANPGQFNLLMPLGVSYFMIRLIDTQLRWYRGHNLDVSFREFLLFIVFPGTLIAGPIENIKDFHKNRLSVITQSDYAEGLSRILIGIFKKVVIADSFLYQVMSSNTFYANVFGGDYSYSLVNSLIIDPSGSGMLPIVIFGLSGLLFAYVDFSAYSDMAIGFSRLLGHRIQENFNFPMFAVNIREYWKRWHMSLSNWAFQNIYFPLMVKTRNSYIPIYVTMLVIGLWHSFNLSWFSWAIHHSTGMIIVSTLHFLPSLSDRLSLIFWPMRVGATILFVSMGFMFVYFNNYEIASTLYVKYWDFALSFPLKMLGMI
jgi:alginate O-acetyltransferase complex protein AlgI